MRRPNNNIPIMKIEIRSYLSQSPFKIHEARQIVYQISYKIVKTHHFTTFTYPKNNAIIK